MFGGWANLLGLYLVGLASAAHAGPLAEAAQRKGTPWYVWLLIVLVLIAFALFVYWWWTRGREEEPRRAAAHPPAEATAVAPPTEVELPAVSAQPPEPVTAPVTRAEEVALEPDDLKLIEGIGPRIASILQGAGIQTFVQLAAAQPDQIRKILESVDPRLLRLADPATWPEQAKLAASGDFDALKKLQDALRGGRQAQ